MPLDQGHPDDDRPLFADAKQDAPMPLGDHLEELRGCVIRAMVGVFVIFFVVVLPPVATRIISWLARPLLSAMHETGYPPQTFVTDPTAGFTSVYLPVSFITALIVASPWVLYQLWRFVSVGLYANERRAVHILVPFSTFMTALGVGFTYYVMLPVSLMFFLSFAKLYPQVEPGEPGYVLGFLIDTVYGSDRPDPRTFEDPATAIIPALPVLANDPDPLLEGLLWIDGPSGTLRMVVNGRITEQTAAKPQLMTPLPKVDEYVRFAAYLGLGVVAAFQLPVLMLVTGWTGLVDPDWVAKGRKYALFVCVCLGGILTPTDLLSMAVLSVPLYGLFELGLLLMRFAHRGGAQADSAEA
ncbi:MAG: twin-arginine translocase subunit TatC [Planctomycetota bacterium]